MSRWITLNIEGIAPDELPELFEGMWAFEDGGRVVAYEFKSRASTNDKESMTRRLALAAFEAGADRVVGIMCGDTSDWVWAIEYCAGDARTLVEGKRWQGDHGYRRRSDVIVSMTSHLGYRPNLGGNWYHENEDHEIRAVEP